MSTFDVPNALLRSEGELERPRSLLLYGDGDRKRDGNGEWVSKWWLLWPLRSRLDKDALLLAGFKEHSAQVWCAGLPSLECFGHGFAMDFGFVDNKQERLLSFSHKR